RVPSPRRWRCRGGGPAVRGGGVRHRGRVQAGRPGPGDRGPARLGRPAGVRLLVLGGTSFVGRAIVEDGLRHGADVTLFNRGRTGAGLFPGVARLTGDREAGDYAALNESGRWDAVADVTGTVPRHVGEAMDALGDRVGRYLFISSHAVYAR